jgi:very-short-patch-repair endonuclease
MKHDTERPKGKIALLKNLQTRFGNVKTEASFPWLIVPDRVNLPDELRAIRKALIAYRGHDGFDNPGFPLRCDFFLTDIKLIIEIDERQHFTAPRRIALENYPRDMILGFNRDEWIAECSRIAAKDDDPVYRDEQRAYYDTIRDIFAEKNGLRPIFRVNEAILRTSQGVKGIITEIDSRIRRQAMQVKIVTVCVQGQCAESAKENPGRVRLLHRVIQEVKQLKWHPDVILFPGGFFYLPKPVGPLDYQSRINQITKEHFSKNCIEASKTSRAVIVAGVDGDGSFNQLCIAWNSKIIAGLGRKIFPSKGDNEDASKRKKKFIVYEDDFSSSHRMAKLRNSRYGLLCSCYDMYGCTETSSAPGIRSRNIEWLGSGNGALVDRSSKRNIVRDRIKIGLAAWEKMVKEANVGLAAIHFFSQTGERSGKGYWQRHGIETPSKVLGGKLAFGASHFEVLPKDPKIALLAAKNGKKIEAVEHCWLNLKGHNVLLRLFEA